MKDRQISGGEDEGRWHRARERHDLHASSVLLLNLCAGSA